MLNKHLPKWIGAVAAAFACAALPPRPSVTARA